MAHLVLELVLWVVLVFFIGCIIGCLLHKLFAGGEIAAMRDAPSGGNPASSSEVTGPS
jgi:hypothetical protein